MCRREAKASVPNIFQKCSALTLEQPQEISWKAVQRLPVALLHILIHCHYFSCWPLTAVGFLVLCGRVGS